MLPTFQEQFASTFRQIAFVRNMVAGFVEHLPDGVYVEEDRVEVDGSWVTERIINRLPIEWDDGRVGRLIRARRRPWLPRARPSG